MAINVTVPGFHTRFPNTGVSSADVGSVFLYEAAEWVHSSLASKYVVPFSSSNDTATRLAYQKAWHLLKLRTIDPNDSDEMGKQLEEEIAALLDGKKGMIQSNGSVLFPDEQDADEGEQIWSTTMDYAPTFSEDDSVEQRVDPDKITDIRNDL